MVPKSLAVMIYEWVWDIYFDFSYSICRVLMLMNKKTILTIMLQKIKKFISLLGTEM